MRLWPKVEEDELTLVECLFGVTSSVKAAFQRVFRPVTSVGVRLPRCENTLLQ